jgi:hypothetical protein
MYHKLKAGSNESTKVRTRYSDSSGHATVRMSHIALHRYGTSSQIQKYCSVLHEVGKYDIILLRWT